MLLGDVVVLGTGVVELALVISFSMNSSSGSASSYVLAEFPMSKFSSSVEARLRIFGTLGIFVEDSLGLEAGVVDVVTSLVPSINSSSLALAAFSISKFRSSVESRLRIFDTLAGGGATVVVVVVVLILGLYFTLCAFLKDVGFLLKMPLTLSRVFCTNQLSLVVQEASPLGGT